MAASINGYGKRLADTRTQYNEAAAELRDSYRKDLNKKEKQHTEIQEDQKEIYLKQRDKLEQTQARNLGRYDRKLNKNVERLTNRYKDGLETEQRSHVRDRKKLMEDYNTKLKNISKSFSDAGQENEGRIEALRERQAENLEKREESFNRTLSDLYKTSVDKYDELRDTHKSEKQKVLDRHVREKRALVQDANLAKSKLNDIHRLEKNTLREDHRRELETTKNSAEETQKSLLASKQVEQQEQHRTFEELTERLSNKSRANLQKLSEKNKENKRNLEKDFAKQVNWLKRKANKLADEGHTSKSTKFQKGVDNRWQERLDGIRSEIEELNYKNQENNKRISESQQESLEQLEKDYKREIDQGKAETRRFRDGEIADLQKKFEKRDQNRMRHQRYLETEFENRELAATHKSKKILDRTKVDHNHLVNKINYTHTQNAEDLKKELLKEQTTVIEGSKRQSSREKAELRKDLKSQHARREDGLSRRIEAKELERKKVVEEYERKIARIRGKAAEEIVQSKILENERRYEDKLSVDRELKIRDEINQKEAAIVRFEMEKKLAKSKTDADIYVTKLIEKYENVLREERREFQRTLRRRLSSLNAEKDRLVRRAEIQRSSLIQQYESKIEDLKQANRIANELKETRQQS